MWSYECHRAIQRVQHPFPQHSVSVYYKRMMPVDDLSSLKSLFEVHFSALAIWWTMRRASSLFQLSPIVLFRETRLIMKPNSWNKGRLNKNWEWVVVNTTDVWIPFFTFYILVTFLERFLTLFILKHFYH